jgi:hypothetical protein
VGAGLKLVKAGDFGALIEPHSLQKSRQKRKIIKNKYRAFGSNSGADGLLFQ